MAYQPGVYKTSGGDEQVVASSGVIRVLSGGTITMESGATLTLAGQAVNSTGTLTGDALASTGAVTGSSVTSTGPVVGVLTATYGLTRYIETATTSWASIAAYGVSVVKPSTAATLLLSLAAPSAGKEKIIICIGATTGQVIVTSSGASATVNGNTSILISSGVSTDPENIKLIGLNSTAWLVIDTTTDVTFSST